MTNMREIADWERPLAPPVVSVCMITYNHERFIAQAIDSVLMQETDFPLELVIGEDCSTDATRAIVVEYAERYPQIIRPLLPEHNLGMMPNFVATLSACKGKYIALLEGDDYWTDPHKLQKQVESLEAHPECVLCHHNAMIIDESGRPISDSNLPVGLQRDFLAEELVKCAHVLTLTACFRNVLRDYPPEFFKVLNGDSFLFSLLGNHGKSKYLGGSVEPDVYRVHAGGVWSALGRDWRQAWHRVNTFFWLRSYYWSIGQNKYSQHFALSLPTGSVFYGLTGADSLHVTLTEFLRELDDSVRAAGDEVTDVGSRRGCLTANLYVTVAFGSFISQLWEQGSWYLQQAIQLDPVAWRDGISLEEIFIREGRTIARISGGFDTPQVSNYLTGVRHHLPRELRLSGGSKRRILGRLFAEAAYACHLSDDLAGVRSFSWQALRADPLLAQDVGMLRRALRV